MFGRLLNLGLLGFLAAKAYPKVYEQIRGTLTGQASELDSPAAPDSTRVEKHMEVLGSDGQHVGTVDHLAIRLTRTDPSANGRHHVLDFDTVATVRDDAVILKMPAADAKIQQMAIEK